METTNTENNTTTESRWEDAAYIDESFRRHLIEGECPLNDAFFSGRSYFEYSCMAQQIENGSLDNNENPFADWWASHNALNFFDGSICGYNKEYSSSDIGNIFRFSYHCDGEIVVAMKGRNSFDWSLSVCSRQRILYEMIKFNDTYDNPDRANSMLENLSSYIAGNGVTATVTVKIDDVDYEYNSMGMATVRYANDDDFGFWNMPFKVFDNWEHAVKYLYTGDETGLMYSPVPKPEYSSALYLEDFQITVHDSNDFGKYYLAFSYKIPNDLDLDLYSKSLKLRIDNQYEWEGYSLKGLARNYESLSELGTTTVDLKENPFGFILYLDDFESIRNFFGKLSIWGPAVGDITPVPDKYKRKVLGQGGLFEDTSFSLGVTGSINNGSLSGGITGGVSVPGSAIKDITKSLMYLNCYVVQDGYKEGHVYSGSVDLLTGKNSVSSYTPDANGSYTYNDDQKSNGYYYTEVSTDSQNNPVYNYYYIDIDNSKTAVNSSGEPVSTGSVVQNNTVTIPDVIRVILIDERDSSDSGNVPSDTPTE